MIAGGTPDVPSHGDVEREFTVEARTQSQLVRRRFFHHRVAMVSLIVLLFVVLLAFVGAQLWKYDYDEVLPLDEPRPADARRDPVASTATAWRSANIRSGRTTSAATTSRSRCAAPSRA